MTKTPKNRGPVAIKIEGGRNIRLDNNVSIGMPLLDATNVENLTGTGNRTVGYDEPQPPARKPWYEHTLAKIIISIAAAVAAAGIIYATGWN